MPPCSHFRVRPICGTISPGMCELPCDSRVNVLNMRLALPMLESLFSGGFSELFLLILTGLSFLKFSAVDMELHVYSDPLARFGKENESRVVLCTQI